MPAASILETVRSGVFIIVRARLSQRRPASSKFESRTIPSNPRRTAVFCTLLFLRKAAHEGKVILKKCVFPRADIVRRRRQSTQHDAGKRRPPSASSVALDIASEPLAF